MIPGEFEIGGYKRLTEFIEFVETDPEGDRRGRILAIMSNLVCGVCIKQTTLNRRRS